LHSVKTGETGFSRAHGMAFFDYLEQHPESLVRGKTGEAK